MSTPPLSVLVIRIFSEIGLVILPYRAHSCSHAFKLATPLLVIIVCVALFSLWAPRARAFRAHFF